MKILLFASARQRIGSPEVDIEIAEPASVASLRSAFTAAYPDLAGLIASSRFAVDRKFVEDDTIVSGDQEIAFIPPVSGG
jgi:molybdopterin converting factor subunit 1